MITEGIFKGTKSIIFENESIRVIVLPEVGGKVASFYHKPKDFELLFQNKENVYQKANIGSSFELFDVQVLMMPFQVTGSYPEAQAQQKNFM